MSVKSVPQIEKPPAKLTSHDYTVGWICAHPLSTRDSDRDARRAITSPYQAQSIRNKSAAAVVTRIDNTFTFIRTTLMVGVGGSIPSKVRLGDISVGTPSGQWPGVVQWDFGKAESDAFRRIGALDNPPATLLIALSKLEARHLVDELLRLQSQHKANILATSRFIDDITEEFQQPSRLELRTSSEDIGAFLAANMGNLPILVRQDKALQETIMTTISEVIDGSYLPVLYIEFLEDKITPIAMKDALEGLHQRAQGKFGEDRQLQLLSKAYNQVIERINSQRQGSHKLARDVLSWLAFAKKPFQALELQDALAVEPEDTWFHPTNRPNVETMVSVRAGLVAIDEESNVIRLVHYTTQEYFLKDAKIGSLMRAAVLREPASPILYLLSDMASTFHEAHNPCSTTILICIGFVWRAYYRQDLIKLRRFNGFIYLS
ncbi:hypothetical protein BJX64DRAFT_288288 [Aspergillus heterothallicus]